MSVNLTRDRINAVAELLSQGLRVCEIQAHLRATKGEVASLIRHIRKELGEQAV